MNLPAFHRPAGLSLPALVLPALVLPTLLLLGDCAAYQAERDRRSLRLIENDIELLQHAGRILDTVYVGGRSRPNITRGVERARRGDKMSRNMLPDMLAFVQGYMRKFPDLHSRLPEVAEFERDRQLLLKASDPADSIEIYHKLRGDIDRSLAALRKRRDHIASGKKTLPTPDGRTG